MLQSSSNCGLSPITLVVLFLNPINTTIPKLLENCRLVVSAMNPNNVRSVGVHKPDSPQAIYCVKIPP